MLKANILKSVANLEKLRKKFFKVKKKLKEETFFLTKKVKKKKKNSAAAANVGGSCVIKPLKKILNCVLNKVCFCLRAI